MNTKLILALFCFALAILAVQANVYETELDDIYQDIAQFFPTTDFYDYDQYQDEQQSIYTVKSGDSLSKIASKFGCTVSQLVSINHIKNANAISVGQKITLCNGAPTPSPSPSPSPSPAPSGSKVQAVVKTALSWVGKARYVFGGCDFVKGIDCSCFVQQLYRQQGINISRTSGTQLNDGHRVASLSQSRAGDLVVYDGHVAMVISGPAKNGQVAIVHASNPKVGVQISNNAAYRPILGIRRIIP